jgi:hypothetical protein
VTLRVTNPFGEDTIAKLIEVTALP